ncbi:MAG: Ig-like domain-containing protein [Eubacterium sp.]|nr:Ig-like domain-containing protein [Eubacterium sp.]
MKKSMKKMIAGVLTLAIVMTMCLTVTPLMASAASWKVAYKTNGVVTVPSGQTFDTTIETKTYGKIAWQTTLLNTTVGYTVTIYDMDRNKLGTIQVSADDSGWKSEQQMAGMVYYHIDQVSGIEAGTCLISVKFDSDSDIQAMFSAQTCTTSTSTANAPTLKNTEETVTAGFQTKLSVKGDTIKNCTSSDKSIATVTSKGVVTGKKKGTATITVTTAKGYDLTCKVNVKANTYSVKKATASDVRAYSYKIIPYSAKYDSKGNLVVKAMAINNMPTKVKTKVWVNSFNDSSNNESKKITVTLPANSAKSVTLKYPKSCLLDKKINLPVNGIKIFELPQY